MSTTDRFDEMRDLSQLHDRVRRQMSTEQFGHPGAHVSHEAVMNRIGAALDLYDMETNY